MTRNCRQVFETRPVHGRCAAGVTHAVHHGLLACGAPNVPACAVTTRDPIDCMACLSHGLESDVNMATLLFEPPR